MKQVVQGVSGGPVRVVDVPAPVPAPTEVLVRTVCSVISPGTERAVAELAQSGLLAKARARPDLVRQVARKARADGVRRAVETVRARLDADVPLGYSAAGVAVEVGAHVAGIRPGQLVATGGAGRANHAEIQAVPGLLCAPVPDGVGAPDAAFATVASIALHGLRLAEVGPGARVVVVGLGLIGQLAARLAQASGCVVAGIDVAEAPLALARDAGVLALAEQGETTTAALAEWTRGRGADAVIVAAADATASIMARVPERCRDRAAVVVIGDVRLDLDRRALYDRELTVRVARSYGPGRYETGYEDWGVDYPAGHVRWTEGRNQEAVLDLLASGRLAVADLVTHTFPIAEAAGAYELILERREPVAAVQLTYPDAAPAGPVVLRPRTVPTGSPGVGLIGTGAFAGTVLVPALRRAGFDRFVAAASASGLSARRLGERVEAERIAADPDDVIADPDVDVVVIATPHESHARLAAAALRAGKAVWCEKPLALTADELAEVRAAWTESPGVLLVGFNRRWSPAVGLVREHLRDRTGPLVTTYRVSAGRLPEGHWTTDRRHGGRLLGEVCHFVDTCAALADEVVDVAALASADGELLLADDIVLAVRHADGSLSTIAYASGGPRSLGKERVEIVGGGRHAVIDDFRTVELDGHTHRLGGQDKGHDALARELHRAVHRGTPVAWGLDTSAHVIQAVQTMGRLHGADRDAVTAAAR
jgi:predicted dehydrogenase/threonine dehydrogenase-like Zn-dependent dehydrogenase